MPTTVVTSRKANEDFQNIKTRHSGIVEGMMNQKLRVDAYNQQKDIEKQNQLTMQNEMKNQQMAQQTVQQKNAMDFHQKQQELELKKIALSQP